MKKKGKDDEKGKGWGGGEVQQGHRSGVFPDELKKARQGTRAAHGHRRSYPVGRGGHLWGESFGLGQRAARWSP